MVVALFALSLVMILGGIASVVQGFPYVRLESGLAMVIGGATAASAGAVLVGLAAVVMRLKRIEEAFGAARDGDLPLPLSLPREIGPFPPSAASGAAPVAAGAAGLAGLTVGGMGLAAGPREQAPPQDPVRDAEPVLPDLLPPDEPAPAARSKIEPPPLETPAAPEPAPPEEDLFADSAPGSRRDERPPLRPSLDTQPAEDTTPPAQETPETEPPEAANPVVGTYASGGNTYVMFADGTIEADTPRGRFAFGSLQELKAFIEAGGETDARGAA